MILASFPSPDRSVWDLGPVPIRAYALCIIAGIVVAVWLGERRWMARGGKQGTVSDVAVWAVISGLVGGRLYHVITDDELYFREGRDPWRALYIWEGGLGIWGAIALGGVGAWWACRQRGIRLPPFADAVAPGIAVAQSIGRWGNYFNQELFGRPTDLPWAVEIDPDRPSTVAGQLTYHPAFLYESLWTMALAVVLLLVDRRYRLGRGRVFALYLMGYTAGRVWIELLRIDTANEILGTRINVWTSIVVFLGALAYFVLRRGPRETEVEPATVPTGTAASAAAAKPDAKAGAATGTAAAAKADAGAATKTDPATTAGTDAATGADAGVATKTDAATGADADAGTGAAATTAPDVEPPAGAAATADGDAATDVDAGTDADADVEAGTAEPAAPAPGATVVAAAAPGAVAATDEDGPAAEAPAAGATAVTEPTGTPETPQSAGTAKPARRAGKAKRAGRR